MMNRERLGASLRKILRGVCAVVLLAGAQTALALDCDVNSDGSINRLDVDLVVQARNTPASANDPRDPNHDGSITATDARICVTRCSLPRCAVGPVAASMQLSLPQPVVGAASTVVVTPTVLDSAGKPITPAPAVSYQVVPDATTAGAAPIVNGNQIELPADSRGSFTILGTMTGTGVTAQARFTVIQNAAQSVNSGLYVTLSAAQSSLVQNLATISQAVQSGDTGAVQAASAALAAAAASVDPEAMSLSTVYEPDSGFVPTASQLASRGFGPTAGDAGFAARTSQLRTKLQQITQLLNQPTGNDATDNATLAQYASDLQTLWDQLRLPANRAGVHGLSNNALAVNELMSSDMPKTLRALVSRVNAQLQASGLAARQTTPQTLYGSIDRPSPLLPGAASPKAMYATTRPVFGLTGLLGGAGPIGGLIQDIYGDYLDQVQKMYLLLAAQGLLNQFLNQTAGVDGLITGGAQSFHVYHAFDSIIEVTGISLAEAQNADVFLIGGAAVNAVDGLIDQLRSIGSIRSIRDLYNFYQGMLDAIQSAGEAYEEAHQQPNFYIQTGFDEAGCLSSLADRCVEMHYNSGFNYVGSGGPVNLEPVIILVRVKTPQNPQFGSNIFNFVGR